MAETRDWTRTCDGLPKQGEVVETMTSKGKVSDLKMVGKLWFLPDGSMYVYYTPVYWRRLCEDSA